MVKLCQNYVIIDSYPSGITELSSQFGQSVRINFDTLVYSNVIQPFRTGPKMNISSPRCLRGYAFIRIAANRQIENSDTLVE